MPEDTEKSVPNVFPLSSMLEAMTGEYTMVFQEPEMQSMLWGSLS